MKEIWNYWGLKPPPICTVKMLLHHKEIRNLIELVCEASATLTNFNCLNREAAILSRLLYKCKRSFRQEKGFQNLSKIYQCLKRYLRLNLSHTVKTFRVSLPKEIKAGASHAYLPTRQMLKWLLLRLLAFSQIFARVIDLAKATGKYLYEKLHLGQRTGLSLVIYSLTARILVASKFLVMKSIEWYNSLYRYQPYLEETTEFIPEFTLPVNLKKWLGDVDEAPFRKKTPIDEMFELIALVRDDDDDVDIKSENLFKRFKVKVREDSEFEDSDVEEVNQVPTDSVEDLGVPVREEEEQKRNEFRMNKRKRKKERAKWLKKQESDSKKRRQIMEVMDVDD